MNILLVDDHPIILELYKNVLASLLEVRQPVFYSTLNCKQAYEAYAELAGKNMCFQLAIIDQSLPPFTEKNLNNGIDIALLLKKKMPECKLIINTAHMQLAVIYEIHKRVAPHGLIIKNDVTIESLSEIIAGVVDFNEYYNSPTVKSSISKVWSIEVLAEDYNRQILHYLAKGYKIKEIEGAISLAATTIQKRIIYMKKAFDIPDNGSLVKTAISRGYI
ncbi:response regulator [uncultured Flavobacterium sp.]|uniref:response regulator n=1 Tax=uncultured Flavobacterium sp. TaxID=165435 RepID=UPI0025DCED0C|nr:response regulator [uncultured Flavobacterium sp.]